eukprot:TRINITY_DN76067_c0_g1_i1.p1 TRINITY_DN76067_c0_g1~~TRINITY_DN76067_c0_g1_i1.p1  ORF type:complete len:569 (+),score=68.67 TRINITY_DN76067_c0_g1_i1:87-1793(+)
MLNMFNGSKAKHSSDGRLRVGDTAPDFEAETTKGKLRFHHWMRNHWSVLFSHPGAFTPVCTTEIGDMALIYPMLRSKGFKLVALSCDSVQRHLQWEKDIVAHFASCGHQISLDFPIISDPLRDVGILFDAIDTTRNSPDDGVNLHARSMFIFDPDKKLQLVVNYPFNVGRDTAELLRICDALLLTSRASVATPASWPDNHSNLVVRGESMQSCVCLLPTLSERDSRRYFPEHVVFEMPSGRSYMRLATPGALNQVHIPAWLRWLAPACCLDGVQAWSDTLLDHSPSEYKPPDVVLSRQHGSYDVQEIRKRIEQSFARSDGIVRVGDVVPDFTAVSTLGNVSFHDWIEGKWTIVLSHAAAFDPVSTTEVGTLALLSAELDSRGIQAASLSCDSLENLQVWRRDILAHFDKAIRVTFPMIADPNRAVAIKYGFVDPLSTNAQTSREVLFIGPDKRLKLSMSYPAAVGGNMHEILRAVDAVQLAAREYIATPASWPNNHQQLFLRGQAMKGAVIVPRQDTDSQQSGIVVNMPSGKTYMRLAQMSPGRAFPVCDNCISTSPNPELPRLPRAS